MESSISLSSTFLLFSFQHVEEISCKMEAVDVSCLSKTEAGKHYLFCQDMCLLQSITFSLAPSEVTRSLRR